MRSQIEREEAPRKNGAEGRLGLADIAHARFSMILFLMAAGVGLLSVRFVMPLFKEDAFGATLVIVSLALIACLAILVLLARGLSTVMIGRPHRALQLAQDRLMIAERRASRLALVAQRTSDAVMILDGDGRIEWANDAYRQVTGRKPAPGETPDFIDATKLREAMRLGVEQAADIRFTTAGGEPRQAELRLTPLEPRDGETAVIVAMRDVTLHRRAERLLSQAVTLLDDSFAVFDSENRLILANKAYKAMLGDDPGAIKVGMTMTEIGEVLHERGHLDLAEQDVETWAGNWAADLRRGVEGATFLAPNGRTYLNRARALDGGYLVTLRTDVTELQAARLEAEAAAAVKSRFLANITHEVRTPLNGVIAMADLLKESRLTEDQRAGLDMISRSGEALLTMINDILDYSKIESEKLVIASDPVNVAEEVEEVVALLSLQAERKGLSLTFRFTPEAARPALGDAGRIRQIATNLIGNAVKFTREGGVEVSLAAEPKGEAAVFHLDVKDTGPGVPEAELEQIFQPFEQGDGVGREGTGLGLSISRQLAELMSGEVSARSTVGFGSTFSFVTTLPRDAAAAPARVIDGRYLMTCEGPQADALADQLAALGLTRVGPDDAADLTFVCVSGAGSVSQPDRIAGTVIVSAPPGWRAPDWTAGGRVLQRPILTSRLGAVIASVLVGEPAPRPAPARGFAHVLLAEDNPTNAAILRAMLREDPVEVDLRTSGAAALSAFEAGAPDIVIMDLQLGDMDGLEATRQMREIEARLGRAPVPIIASTASARDETREACRQAGMDDFVAKPIDKEKLRRTLNRWLSASGARRAR